jgi:predicted NBD/HSP70 family sugar kinase
MGESAQRLTLVPVPVKKPKTILVIDIGGSNVKMLATGQKQVRKFPSGKTLTPANLVEEVRAQTGDWGYDAVSLGYPGIVEDGVLRLEPKALAPGWVGFDFRAAFGKPVKVINDAAMQALGSYEGGRMLYLGLGTFLGSTLVCDRVIVPLELGQLPFKHDKTLNDYLCKDARKEIGPERWEKAVTEAVVLLRNAFAVDYVLLGGGNAKKLTAVPPGARLGGNGNAFLGGFRLWNLSLPVARPPGLPRRRRPGRPDWRVV